jgi:hypothetical protein
MNVYSQLWERLEFQFDNLPIHDYHLTGKMGPGVGLANKGTRIETPGFAGAMKGVLLFMCAYVFPCTHYEWADLF